MVLEGVPLWYCGTCGPERKFAKQGNIVRIEVAGGPQPGEDEKLRAKREVS